MSRRGKNVRVGEENDGEARDGGSKSGDCARRRDRHAGADGRRRRRSTWGHYARFRPRRLSRDRWPCSHVGMTCLCGSMSRSQADFLPHERRLDLRNGASWPSDRTSIRRQGQSPARAILEPGDGKIQECQRLAKTPVLDGTGLVKRQRNARAKSGKPRNHDLV